MQPALVQQRLLGRVGRVAGAGAARRAPPQAGVGALARAAAAGRHAHAAQGKCRLGRTHAV